MTPESRNSLLLGKHFPAEANAQKKRRAVFSVVGAAFIPTQRCDKHISAAVTQPATIEESVFSVQSTPRLYNEDLRQLQLELRASAELAIGRIIEKTLRKELGCAKKNSYCAAVTVRLMNPFPE
jgi:hypothetical protein